MVDDASDGVRLIPDNTWEKFFVGRDGRYIGKKFEEISLDVLNKIFGGPWSKTKESYDGNKDFILNFEKGEFWAESKAYKKAVSYHVISPTLFMALIGQPETVVFISRSPFNKNAKPLLAQYEKKTKKRIICIDGPLLDCVIIRNRDILEKYFPNCQFSPKFLQPLLVGLNMTTELGFSVRDTDKQSLVERDTFDLQRPEIDLVIGVGEVIRVDAVLVNQNVSESIEVEMKFTEKENSPLDVNLVIVDTRGIDDTERSIIYLEKAQVKLVSLYLKGALHGERLSFPDLIFQCGTQEIKRSLSPITVSQLYRIDLVGEGHIQARDDVLRAVSCYPQRNHILMLQGRSGVGKSRVLKEMSDSLAISGYDIHQLNKEFDTPSTSDFLLRQLLANLNNLPFVQSINGHVFPDLKEYTSNYDIDDTALLTRLIYDDDNTLRQNPTMIARALRKSLGSRKFAIIIDNTQNFDDITADSFSDLISLLLDDGDRGRSIIVLAFNTDLAILGSGAEALRRRLERLPRRDTAISKVICRELRGLDDKDVDNFLTKALVGPMGQPVLPTHYPMTFATVKTHIPPNPLHLWETLRYLRDKGVVNVRNGLLTVQDENDSHLASILRTITPNLSQLMQQRWEEIRQAAERKRILKRDEPSGEDLVRSMRVAYILGEGSRKNLYQLGVPERHLNHLVRVGLLREKSYGHIGFFHQQTFRFFQSQFQSFPSGHARELVKCFEKLEIRRSHFEQFLILCDWAELVSEELLKQSAEAFLLRGASHEYFRPFLAILSRKLTRDEQALDDWVFETYIAICNCFQEKESMHSGAQEIRRFYREKVALFRPQRLPAQQLVDFLFRYINANLSIGEDNEALSIVEAALGQIDIIIFPTEQAKELATAKLMDRKLSIIKNFSRYDEAIRLGEDALRIVRAQKNEALEIELLSDCAEIYFAKLTPEDRKQGYTLYQQAIDRFGKDGWHLPDPVPVRSFVNRCYLCLSKGDLRKAVQIAGNGINFAHSIRNHFWNAKLHLLKSLIMVCQVAEESVDFDQALAQIYVTQDFMNAYAANRYEWANQYLKAKLLLLRGAVGEALDSFSATIEAVAERFQGSEKLSRRYELLMDIAVTCRRQEILLKTKRVWSLLSQSVVGTECMAVLTMDQAGFELYWESWKRKVFLMHEGRHGMILTLAKI